MTIAQKKRGGAPVGFLTELDGIGGCVYHLLANVA